MRVFILCSGRTGSVAFIDACKHISNYTAGHETLINKFREERFNFPDNHIEADNRLCWNLGKLDEKYGDNAIYIHLKRDIHATALSFSRRFFIPTSIIDAFSTGIRAVHPAALTKEERLECCYDYIETVDSNVEHFLKDKTNVLTINLESIQTDFPKFWTLIDAKGNLEKSLQSFKTPKNTSISNKSGLLNRYKVLFRTELKYLKLRFFRTR